MAAVCLSLFSCGSRGSSAEGSSYTESQMESSFLESSKPEESSQPEESSEIHSGAFNPLTGEWGMSEEAAGKRPVAIMVNNLGKALPQRGIGEADLLYEVVTEGGITRLMAVFADPDNIPLTGPVRSARHYYITLEEPLRAIYVHYGGSPAAYTYLEQYNVDDVDGRYLESGIFYQDQARRQAYGQEHSFFIGSEGISQVVSRKGYDTEGETTPPFSFASEEQVFSEAAQTVSVYFSSSYYSDLDYHSDEGVYYKKRNGADHIDGNTEDILTFTNILVMFTDVTSYNGEAERREVSFAGGEGYYFTKGTAQKIWWSKDGVQGNFSITDKNGAEVLFNPGKSYICMVGNDMKNRFSYGAGQ